MEVDPITGRQRRGFATMTKEARTAAAKKGGASVAAENRSFSKDRALAQRAGQQGGLASHQPTRRKRRARRPAEAASE